MNAQETRSAYSTLLVSVLGIGMGALVAQGVMTKEQSAALAPELCAAILGVATIAIGWWKKRQHSPVAVAAAVAGTPAVASAVVAAVNSSAVPGVKVVADTSASPAVALTNTGKVVSAHEHS
jgi:hypothetical protein